MRAMARHRLAGVSARAWRAMALVGLALVAVAVVAFAHLHRGPVGTAPARPSAPPAPPDRWGLLLASFGDADHGVVVMSETSGVRDTYVTADAGHTWQPRHVGVSATTFLDPHRAIAVEAAPRPRLESTADAGRSWVQLSTPVRGPALGLLLNRTSGGPTFLDQAHGWWLDAPPGPQPGPIALWRTGDGGRTWRALSASGLTTGEQLGQPAFVDPLRGAVLLSTLNASWPSLMTTQDGGETWRPTALPAPPAAHLSLAAHVTQATQMLVRDGRLLAFLTLVEAGEGVTQWSSVSEAGGLVWTPWSKAPATTMFPSGTPLLDDAGRLLLADDRRLWTSDDDGRTWGERLLDLPAGTHALVVVSARAGALFVAARRTRPDAVPDVTLLRSLDWGGRWTEIHLPHQTTGSVS